jgi:lantibiotic modifying enzyme
VTPDEAVARLAARLAAGALWHDGRATWFGDDAVADADGSPSVVYRSLDGDLYGGTAGIALFLARHAAAGGDDEVRRAAAGAARHALDWVARARPDGALLSGAGGVATACLEAGRLLGDESLVAGAAGAARWAVEHPPRGWDLVGGLAGYVPALLRLADDLAGVDDETAQAAGDAADEAAWRLIAGAVPGPVVGIAWPADTGDALPLAGLAHGASGPALALVEWGTRRHHPEAVAAAGEAAAYERAWFSAERGTWADLRGVTTLRLRHGEGPAWPELWCHGALGIGTQRLRHVELTGAEWALVEAGVAIDAASRAAERLGAGPVPDLSLCHGLGGALELLLDAAAALRQPVLADLARDAAQAALDLVGDGPWPCGIPGGGESPSLFVGLAGIGTALQRLGGAPSTARAYADRAMSTRVIVRLVGPPDAQSSGALVAAVRGAIPGARVERVSHSGRVLLRLPVDADEAAALAILGQLEGVAYAELDTTDHAVGDTPAP